MFDEEENPDDVQTDPFAAGAIPDKDALRQKLYGNLMDRLNGKGGNELAGAQKEIADSDRQNALAAALARSSAQIGSTGGKIADTSSVDDMAKSMQGEGQQELGGLAQDVGRKDNLQKYLLGQIQRSDSVDARVKAQAASRTAALQQAKDKLEADNKFKGEENQKTRDNQKAIAELVAGGRADARNAAAGAKQSADATRLDAKHDKDFLTLQNSMDPTHASSRSAYGKNQAVVDSADKVLQLGEQAKLQDGGLDKRQVHELAMAVGNLVSGGTGTAQATVEALVPHSIGSSAAGIEEWISSNPKGTDQQAFVDRMLDTASREKHLAGEKIKQTQSKILNGPAFSHLKDDPRFEMAKNQNFDPEADQFDKNGVYVPKQFKGHDAPKVAPSGMALGAPASGPKVGTVEDGHTFIGGDPANPNSWKKN